MVDGQNTDPLCRCQESCEMPCWMRPGVTSENQERCGACGCGPSADQELSRTEQPADPRTYDELLKQVQSCDGVLTVPMSVLRTISGAQRLGKRVRMQIKRDVEHVGLRVGPGIPELPGAHDAAVRLYDPKSPVGRLIDASVTLGEDHDERLRQIDRHGAATKMQRIRKIIGS